MTNSSESLAVPPFGSHYQKTLTKCQTRANARWSQSKWQLEVYRAFQVSNQANFLNFLVVSVINLLLTKIACDHMYRPDNVRHLYWEDLQLIILLVVMETTLTLSKSIILFWPILYNDQTSYSGIWMKMCADLLKKLRLLFQQIKLSDSFNLIATAFCHDYHY